MSEENRARSRRAAQRAVPAVTEDPAGDAAGTDERPLDGGILSRWSRLKSRRRAPAPPVDAPAGTASPEASGDAPDPVPVAPADEDGPARDRTDADMPPLETLHAGSDFSAFMSPGVSDALRQAALRKLFRLPKFNVIDPLDDYNEDFRTFAPLGEIVTAEMRHRAEAEARRARERAEEALADHAGADGRAPVAANDGAANAGASDAGASDAGASDEEDATGAEGHARGAAAADPAPGPGAASGGDDDAAREA